MQLLLPSEVFLRTQKLWNKPNKIKSNQKFSRLTGDKTSCPLRASQNKTSYISNDSMSSHQHIHSRNVSRMQCSFGTSSNKGRRNFWRFGRNSISNETREFMLGLSKICWQQKFMLGSSGIKVLATVGCAEVRTFHRTLIRRRMVHLGSRETVFSEDWQLMWKKSAGKMITRTERRATCKGQLRLLCVWRLFPSQPEHLKV